MLDNGIRASDTPARAPQIATELDAATIDAVFRKWARGPNWGLAFSDELRPQLGRCAYTNDEEIVPCLELRARRPSGETARKQHAPVARIETLKRSILGERVSVSAECQSRSLLDE